MNVIEKIEKLKNQRNWTDYTLALEAGISQSTFASIKQRNTPPKLEVLQQICEAFGLTLAQFFLEDEQIEVLNESEKELLTAYRALSKNKQIALLSFLKN